MTNRVFFMALAAAVQDVYQVDMSWFDFRDLFVIDTDDEVYATKRGYALGWMNEAITIVIIRWLREWLSESDLLDKTDFVVFNDDSEIAFFSELDRPEMELVKFSLVEFFKNKDVPCSIKKIYFSQESVFLEEYYAPDSKFNFEKRTVATRLYAKAIMCSLPFLRKCYTNAAAEIWYCKDIVEEIISKTRNEFPHDHEFESELDLPFESGGWFSQYQSGLNFGLVNNLKPTLISHFLSQIEISIETAPYTGEVDSKQVNLKEAWLMSRARKNFLPAVDDEEIDENFQFDLGTDITLYQNLLKDDSILLKLCNVTENTSVPFDKVGDG